MFMLFAYAAVTFSEHHFVIPMLMLAFALTKVMTSVLKEIRVMAIKQQVSAAKTSLASSFTDT
ncbi:hypothetical protein GCM10009332_17770 [Shewanella gelidii]|uniref:Uncharacterized protein n=1 Tax=Shewanella gelidii TaxID=1642821 RepID=A0A917JRZ4_9GAMM|nr:hypothetical protein GCM10009332_17770 [Shewanella gelidii]